MIDTTEDSSPVRQRTCRVCGFKGDPEYFHSTASGLRFHRLGTCHGCLRKRYYRKYAREKEEGRRKNWPSQSPEAVRARHKKWCVENKDLLSRKKKDSILRSVYGISLEDYERMVVLQGGKCAICDQEPKVRGNIGILVIDHCHKSNKIRGLLCPSCNRGLGMFDDNPKSLSAAAAYIKRHSVGDAP